MPNLKIFSISLCGPQRNTSSFTWTKDASKPARIDSTQHIVSMFFNCKPPPFWNCSSHPNRDHNFINVLVKHMTFFSNPPIFICNFWFKRTILRFSLLRASARESSKLLNRLLAAFVVHSGYGYQLSRRARVSSQRRNEFMRRHRVQHVKYHGHCLRRLILREAAQSKMRGYDRRQIEPC